MIEQHESERMSPSQLHFELSNKRSMCPCGYVLVPKHNKDGKRIGVTHRTDEEDIHHFEYFAGMAARIEEKGGPDNEQA